MNRFFLIAYAALTLGAGRVAAQGPTYGFARDTDFSKYKTYKWVSMESAQHLDDLTADQVMGTLETELAKKGLIQSKSDKADLHIGYQIASGNVKRLNHYDIGSDYAPPAPASAEAAGEAATTVHSGPLVLYMYDAAKKQLVWWSVLPNAIDADADPDKKQKHLDKAIAKLLKDYPPQKKPWRTTGKFASQHYACDTRPALNATGGSVGISERAKFAGQALSGTACIEACGNDRN